MSSLALFKPDAFAEPHSRKESDSARYLAKMCEPFEEVDGHPLAEHVCQLKAAFDPECGRIVVLDAGATGLFFEVDTEDQILVRAEEILSDLIEVNDWPRHGWAILVSVFPDIADIVDPEDLAG
jgi:hypothetical protein